MAEIKGLQIVGFVNGGSANGGEDVFVELRLSSGTDQVDQRFFIAHDKLALLLIALAQFGGMARNTRLSRNPRAEADQEFAGAHAFDLADCFGGKSMSQGGKAILTLQASAGEGRLANFYLAADSRALTKLRDVCQQMLTSLQSTSQNEPKGLN